MMYSEFTTLTGLDTTISERDYHVMVEPQYYRHPGDKYEFLRDWLASEIMSIAETMRHIEQERDTDKEIYKECKSDLQAFSAGLAKLLSA